MKIQTEKYKGLMIKSWNSWFEKSVFTFLSLILVTLSANSQKTIDEVLIEIEKNNSTLSAIRTNIEAEKIGNKTGIYLSNPEFEMGYLWGEPSILGKRTDLSLTQSFQFPTAYKYKKRISGIKNEQLEIDYQENLKSIILQSKQICIELIYTNAMISNYEKRLENAQVIADSYKAKFDAGETNVIEYNKAQINLLNQNNNLQSLLLSKNSLLSELKVLNGGIEIEFSQTEFTPMTINDDFENWYSGIKTNIPALNWYEKEFEKQQSEIKLVKASNLPEFQAGYMSESLSDEKFQGVAFGISIPLWENKNSVKHSKAKLLAVEEQQSDIKIRVYNHLLSLYNNAKTIEKNLNNYKLGFSSFDNSNYLQKAFDNGEISLIDYMMELSLYYESLDNILELEKQLQLAISELYIYN